ncbi:glycosyl hydrolase 53 family protein [Anaerobutyricum hallii]|uniref:glycosyl hydrolase 53 family protein n=1 Tax=Anaerobutyricum hallii TaxID=39488 RepID=UPI0032C148D4
MKMKNLEKFSGAIKRCVAIAMASMLFATTGFSLDTHPVKAQEVSSSADKIEIPEISKDAFKKYKKISGIGANTILGADFTYYQQCLEWGKSYKNYMSQSVDNIFDYVKSQGINTISLKVAVNPTGENAYLSLENAIKTLKAVKASNTNLKTNLVLLYSDEITYAGTQNLPADWEKAEKEEQSVTRVESAKTYTRETIAKLKQANVLPDIVTIGNEVNWNFLGITDGEGWEGWKAMGDISALLKKEGVKNAVSIAAQPDAASVKYIVQKLGYASVDYDYIGVNVYPDNNTNSYIKSLKNEVESCAPDKQLIVSNVEYERVNEANTANVYTQADSIYNLLEATIDEKNAGGLIYNEAAYVGSWKSFFDDEGDAQVSMAIFAYAQGNETDTSRDPYKYGDDTGLKQQKVTIKKVKNMSDSTIRGIDISSYTALKKAGVKYYDNEGKEASLLKVLSDNGVNYIRIRIWNDPYNEKGETYGGGSNDVKAGLEIAKEAAKYNIKVLLGFHYSDFWADPAVQLLPKAWEKDRNNHEKMCSNVYEFTKETLEQFKDAGADIGMVQVGNEISQGMMGIMHRTKANVWQEEEKSVLIDSYLNAGARAVRECVPDALVAIHLDTLNLSIYKDAMNAWERDKVDYDVLGSSSYAFWAGKNMLGNVRKAGNYVASRGKLFAVLETSWLNSQKDADGTVNMVNNTKDAVYKVGPQGQADMLSDLYDAILSNDNGLGAFYWEGAWIPVKAGWVNWKYNKEMANEFGTGWATENAGGYYPKSKLYYNGNPVWGGDSWDNQTLFDDKGYPLDSLRFYKDAVSSNEKYSRVVIALCDKENNVLEYRVVKVISGKSMTYTLPEIKGYTKEKDTIKILGTNDKISKVSVVYNKDIKKQTITVKKASYTIPYGTKFNLKNEVKAVGSLTFTSNNTNIVSVEKQGKKLVVKKPGKVKIKITAGATADYKQTSRIVTIYAVPKKQTIKKVSTAKRKVKVNIKKDVKATGYQIVAAKNSRFSKGKKVLTKKGTRQVTYTITKLNSRKIYYVKARAYKTIGNKKYFGPWSKVKKIRIK